MSRDNSGCREAVRRAREALAEREQARKAREEQIEAALASLFTAVAGVERLRAAARQRADKALADGERAAARSYAEACAAALVLHDLLGSNTAVAGLCELRLEDVRDMLAAARALESAPAGGSTQQDPVGVEDQGIGPGQLPGRIRASTSLVLTCGRCS